MGACMKCDDSCLTCTGGTANDCLTCKNIKMRTTTPGTGGACTQVCDRIEPYSAWNNCEICWGTKGCFQCKKGYGRWQRTDGFFICVEMREKFAENCLEAVAKDGWLCKECNYWNGYWMRDAKTCTNKGY